MKRAFKAAFISALLITTVAATLQINIGKANPYQYMGEVPPDANTKPPIISIQSPDSEVYYTNNVSLTFNVSIGKSTTATFPYIFAVYYRGDWQQKNTSVYQSDASHGPLTFAEFSCNLYIPNGNHSILINATEIGKYAYSRKKK